MDHIDYIKCGNEFTYRDRQFNAYTSVEHLTETSKFEFLETDIIITTFPRSGTTFTQEIIWQILNRKTVSKDEKVIDTMSRFPFLEFNHKSFHEFPKSFYEILNSQKEEPYRLIKTHVPFEFIKENFEKVNPKMIVVMRNAKDCLISNYHHYLHPIHDWHGTFNDFFPIFLHGKTYTGSYFDNNLEWWSLRERNNVLILFYEELILNLSENIEKIANFLGESLTDTELDKIQHNCSFATMSNNPKVNITCEGYKLIRKGIVGDWKENLSEEQNQMLNDKIETKFNLAGLKFIYD